MYIQNKLTRQQNNRLYFLLIVATVGLLTDRLLKPALALILIADALIFVRKNFKINKNIFYPIICLMGYSLVQALFYDSNALLLKELVRSFIYILLIYGVSNLYIEMKTYEKIWIYILAFCLCVQVMQFFKIADINKYLIKFYGTTEDSDAIRVANYETLNLFRSGSIFIAINPYFKIVLGVLTIALNKRITAHTIKLRQNSLSTAGIIFAVTSSVFIGSRTCFIVIIICIIEYMFFYKKTLLHFDRRMIIYTVIALIILLLSGYFGNLIERVSNMRMFNIFREDGTTGSLEHKFLTIKHFMDSNNSLAVFFGRGIYQARTKIEQMDSDLGYLYAYYGVFGIIFLYFIVRAIFIRGKEDPTMNNALGIMWSTVIIFSVVTSGVFLNMRVFGSLIVMFFVNKYSLEAKRNE